MVSTMDIDFHYFATYAAARFAGLDGRRALTLATAAQMIDENSLGSVGGMASDSKLWSYYKKIPIKTEINGNHIIDYEIIETFQSAGDIVSSNRTSHLSIWPVFHFLPGNFEIKGQSFSDLFENKKLWERRVDSISPTAIQDKVFSWLTRPYSPMALALIKNATDLAKEKKYENIKDHLMGVTMHVFIDTWAHQDFVGYTSKHINGVEGFPVWTNSENGISAAEWKTENNWGGSNKTGNLAFARSFEFLGHGPAGHYPDSSCLVWKYIPNWSTKQIERNNPKQYRLAFINMIEAIRCIDQGLIYRPIESDISLSYVNKSLLKKIYNLIDRPRDSAGRLRIGDPRPEDLGKYNQGKNIRYIGVDKRGAMDLFDSWDKNMFYFNSTWIKELKDIFNIRNESDKFVFEDKQMEDFPNLPWIPGNSEWQKDAKDATDKGYLTAKEFCDLDYFKFNVAAKLHYRFVEQQLRAFNQQDLLLSHNWPRGMNYGEEYTIVTELHNPNVTVAALSEDEKIKIKSILNDLHGLLKDVQSKDTEARDGIKTLIDLVMVAAEKGLSDVKRALTEVISTTNNPNAEYKFGLIDRHGKETGPSYTVLEKRSFLSRLREINEKITIRPTDLKINPARLDTPLERFLVLMNYDHFFMKLNQALIDSTTQYLGGKQDVKDTGQKRASAFLLQLQSMQAQPDGHLTQLSETFYALFALNKVNGISYGGITGGQIRTDDKSLFTLCAQSLINAIWLPEHKNDIAEWDAVTCDKAMKEWQSMNQNCRLTLKKNNGINSKEKRGAKALHRFYLAYFDLVLTLKKEEKSSHILTKNERERLLSAVKDSGSLFG